MKQFFLFLLGGLWPMFLAAQIATVHMDFTEFECTGSNSGILRCKREITVYNERGEYLCNWSCVCHKGSIELKKFEATITEGNGKTTLVKKNDLSKSNYSDNLADDNYRYYYSPRTSSYPMKITYQWEESFNTLLVYPTFYPINHYDVAVDSAFYRIITTDENTLRYHALNFTPDIHTYKQKGKNVLEVGLSHWPAIKRYSDGLPLDEQTPIIYFAPTRCDYKGTHCDMSDWKTYGQWCYALQTGRDRLPDDLITKLHAMTDSCTSTKSKVGVVRQFLGETTRYVNVALGIGGYQSRSAEEVYRKGIGDCKALSNYFCAMLHALNIPATYTLIGKKDLLDDMPTFQQLNHVIVQVPLANDTLWVECTNAKYPFDYCPKGHRGHEVILIGEDGGTLAKIQDCTDEENQKSQITEIFLDENGDASLTMRRSCDGIFFDAYLSKIDMRNEELRKFVANQIHLPHPTFEAIDIVQDGHRIDLNLQARSLGWARANGQRLFIPISLQTRSAQKKEQSHVIDRRDIGYYERDTMRIHLPEGFSVESMPKSQVLNSEFGNYEMKIETLANDIVITTQLHSKSGLFSEEKYADWAAFWQEIANIYKKNITLKRD